MPSQPRFQLKADLVRALSALSGPVGAKLALDRAGRCGLRIDGFPSDITIEWIEPSGCVAVHAAAPRELVRDPAHKLAPTLMLMQVGGVATMGCSLWLLPDDSLRVALTLVGPTLDEAQLLEAVGRVAKASRDLDERIAVALNGRARLSR